MVAIRESRLLTSFRNVSALGQTFRFLPTKVVVFHLDAPQVLRLEPETRTGST